MHPLQKIRIAIVLGQIEALRSLEEGRSPQPPSDPAIAPAWWYGWDKALGVITAGCLLVGVVAPQGAAIALSSEVRGVVVEEARAYNPPNFGGPKRTVGQGTR